MMNYQKELYRFISKLCDILELNAENDYLGVNNDTDALKYSTKIGSKIKTLLMTNPNLNPITKSKINILQESDEIVNNRSEEGDRQYGPFSEGMDRAARIFNGMTGLDISGREMFKAMIALKLSREGYSHKRDNLMDAAAYIQGLDNYENEKTNGK